MMRIMRIYLCQSTKEMQIYGYVNINGDKWRFSEINGNK